MNELLSSGLVGTKKGTTDEIIKKWQSFGFLDFFGNEYGYTETFALMFEEVAQYLIDNYDTFSNEKTDTVSLVVLGRIFYHIKKTDWEEGKINKFIEQIDIKEIVEFVDDNTDSFTNFIGQQKYAKLLDCEALSYSFIADVIIEQIIVKVKISKEFYIKFLLTPTEEDKEKLIQMSQEIGVELEGLQPKDNEGYRKLESEYIKLKSE